MKLSQIQERVDNILGKNQPPEALELAQKLEGALKEKELQSTNPDAYKEITRIVFALYVFAIPLVSEEVLERILKLNTLEALSLDFGEERYLIERLELRYNIYTEDFQKEKLSQLISYLKQNEEYIGDKKLPIADEQKHPMVKHWLEYYDQEAGLEGHTAFDRSKFISSDPIVQSLSKRNRELLRKVCRLYDFLQGQDQEQHIYELTDAEEGEERTPVSSSDSTEVEPEEDIPRPETEPSSSDAEQEAQALTEQMNDSGTLDLKDMPTEPSKVRQSKQKAIDLKNLSDNSK